MQYQFSQFSSTHLSTLIPSASDEAIDLMASLYACDPTKRPTAAESLKHPFFQACIYVPPSLRVREPISKQHFSSDKGNRAPEEKPGRKNFEVLDDMKTSSNPSAEKMHHSMNSGPQRGLSVERKGTNQEKIFKTIGKQACYRLPVNDVKGPPLVDGNSVGFINNPVYASDRKMERQVFRSSIWHLNQIQRKGRYLAKPAWGVRIIKQSCTTLGALCHWTWSFSIFVLGFA